MCSTKCVWGAAPGAVRTTKQCFLSAQSSPIQQTMGGMGAGLGGSGVGARVSGELVWLESFFIAGLGWCHARLWTREGLIEGRRHGDL